VGMLPREAREGLEAQDPSREASMIVRDEDGGEAQSSGLGEDCPRPRPS
jgi:hypothetical protein